MTQQDAAMQPEVSGEPPTGPVDEAVRRGRPTWFKVTLACVAALVLIGGAALVTALVMRPDHPAPAVAAPPAELTVTGTIVVPADTLSSGQAVGESCATDDGYNDIQTGAQVTIKDAAGKVVALGSLQAGTVAALYGEGDMPALLGYASKCTFAFTVNDVPGGQEIYSVEVSHRGELRFNRDQLEQPLALTLGS